MSLVYGVAIYDEETGYRGMNTWNVYGTVERACSNIDSMLDITDNYIVKYIATDIHKLKYELDSKNYAVYTKTMGDTTTIMYSVVKLRKYD